MNAEKTERVPDYIEHMISAIAQIEKYCHGLDQSSFVENDMAHDAVIRQFEIIGEAARRIIAADPEFTKKHPQMELEGAYRMRNALAHGYESVNLRTVWDTVTDKLPVLKAEATKLLTAALDAGSSKPDAPENAPDTPPRGNLGRGVRGPKP